MRNYTTKIPTEKTILEIESILIKFGAGGIMKEYQGSRVSAIIFYITYDNQKIPFKIPMSLEKSRKVIIDLVNEGKLPRKFLNEPLRSQQGERVTWRIIKDWIDSQLSLLELNFAESIEILLPYIYNQESKQTIYQMFMQNKSKFLSLDKPAEEKTIGQNKICLDGDYEVQEQNE